MSVHYNSCAGFHSSRKSMSSHAKNVEAELEDGVNQKYFKQRFVQDIYHSMAYFTRVCKSIGNLENKEISKMLKKLKLGVDHSDGDVYCFEEKELYRVLISNPVCKNVCEKQGYKNWQDIIARFD